PLHVRRERRGHDREAAVRPVLHQEPVAGARRGHHRRDRQDRVTAARRPMTAGAAPRAIVNAMTVDVEDYFHVSAFDRVVSRASWGERDSRVVANTRRLLEL